MSCLAPLKGYRLESGGVSIGFERAGSVEQLLLPCGECIGCRMDRGKMWAVRSRHEASLWDHNQFVTLSYAPEHIAWHGSLVPDHLTKFLKRLRRSYSGVEAGPNGDHPIRYFAAGEYGGESGRPHFHVLLFNLWLSRGEPTSATTWASPELSELWPYGGNAVGSVEPASAGYVAGYHFAKAYGRVHARDHYSVVDKTTGEVFQKTAEFCRMSIKPGLGSWWYDRFKSDLLRGYMIVDGHKMRIPRYYRDKLCASDADFAERLEAAEAEYLMKQDASEVQEPRLEVRREVAKARRKALTKPRGL